MNLLEVTRRARDMAASGNALAAEEVLVAASCLVAEEQEVEVLRSYAEACHHWGSLDAEEAALRKLVSLEPRLEFIESLLDVLQERLNLAPQGERSSVVAECIELGDRALRLAEPMSGLAWANLIRARGIRHLEAARAGLSGHVAKARADIDAYLEWLRKGASVPQYLQRANLAAEAELDLGELLLLEGRREDAARQLEQTIQQLETTQGRKSVLDRAYALLERAAD